MHIDLSCPVELWHFRMPTTDYPVVSLQMFNLSEKTVTSIQAAFMCYQTNGDRLSRQVERIPDLLGEARSAFEVKVAIEGGEEAASMDFVIEKVWFIDGTVWRRGSNSLTEYEDSRLSPGRQLDVLRHIAGSDAQGYPSDQGAVWVCVCGRPNHANAAGCLRCTRDKREVFTKYNKAAIETIIFERENLLEEKARHAREEAGRMQQAREARERAKAKRRKRLTAAIITLVVLGAGSYGVIFHGIPAYNYYHAGQLMEKKQFLQAKDVYLALEEYSDAPTQALEADYLRAYETQQAATLTSLKAAEDIYLSIPGYQDADELALQMRYRRAELLRKGGEYEQAIVLFNELDIWKDSQSQSTLTIYEWAKNLMGELEYSAAREKFLALGDYRDAELQAEESLYLPAMLQLERNEYELAQNLLEQMQDKSRSLPKLQELHYRWGDELFAQQNFDLAAEKYLLAGDYMDSSRKAASCLYEPAVIAMQEGRYEEAREKLLKIPYFEDAQKLAEESSFHMGAAAMRDGRFEEAIKLFESAPSVVTAQAATLEAAYLRAEELEMAEDQITAIIFYEKAADFADAAERVLKLRYELGITYANERDYKKAADIFALLGDYQNSTEELNSAVYNQAIADIEAGKYEPAIAALTKLGEYSSSRQFLAQAYYAQGQKAFGDGELIEAAKAFEAAGDYEDAELRRQESIYLEARQRLDEGEKVRGTLLLKQVEGYEDAEELLNATAYTLAGELFQDGQYRQAAEQFALIRGYQDAKELAEKSYDLYYGDAYEAARVAIKAGDYKTAVEALEPLDRENPGETYSNVQAMYQDAVYRYAMELYNDQKPYEALPYYRKILGYKDVDSRRLTRVPYRVLGTWQTEDGLVMEFSEDGTCTIDGRKYYFYAQNYLLAVGDRQDDLDIRYNILNLTDKSFNVRRESPKATYRMTRVTAP